MKRLRSVLFWLHLVAGLAAGLVIGVMSFTGVVIAFEHDIVEWAERDVRRVPAPPADAVTLPLDQLIARAVEAAGGEARPSGVTISSDPRDAVAVSLGRETGTRYVNPYTGQVAPLVTTRTHDFMHLMIDWHRWLALSGEQRATGRAITGAANLAFLVLALSGLWLWWPRALRWRALKPALWFTGARGKARDWNWHNVYGFWSLPVLVVLIVTAAVISYPWASDLVYRAVGETPPGSAGFQPASVPAFQPPTPDAPRLTYAEAFAALAAAHPAWTTITLREGLPRRRGAPAPGNAGFQPASGSDPATPRRDGTGQGLGRARVSVQPYSATIRADDGTPSFASTQVVLNPYTAEAITTTGYADLTLGRKLRTWMRFLHTGEALGWPGQLAAALASLAGCVLVYTGFALSWRRFFKRRQPQPAA